MSYIGERLAEKKAYKKVERQGAREAAYLLRTMIDKHPLYKDGLFADVSQAVTQAWQREAYPEDGMLWRSTLSINTGIFRRLVRLIDGYKREVDIPTTTLVLTNWYHTQIESRKCVDYTLDLTDSNAPKIIRRAPGKIFKGLIITSQRDATAFDIQEYTQFLNNLKNVHKV